MSEFMCSTSSPPSPGYFHESWIPLFSSKKRIYVLCKYCRKIQSHYVKEMNWELDWSGVYCDFCGVELKDNVIHISSYHPEQEDPLKEEHDHRTWEHEEDTKYVEVERELFDCVCGKKPKIGKYILVADAGQDNYTEQVGVFCTCGLCTGDYVEEYHSDKEVSENIYTINEAVKEWNKRTRKLLKSGNICDVLAWAQERSAEIYEEDEEEGKG